MTYRKKRGASSGEESEENQSYYYVQGQRVNVSKRDDLVAVRFSSRVPKEAIEAFNDERSNDLEPSNEFQEMQGENLRIYRVAPAQAADVRAFETDIQSQESVEKVGEVYVNEDGRGLILTDELVVKFKPEITLDQIESLKATYGLEIAENIGFSENAYVLKVKPGSEKTSLEIANELLEGGKAVYAYPNWIEHIGYRIMAVIAEPEMRHGVHPTDPNFAQQWYHDNTGQIPATDQNGRPGVAGTVGADIRATLAWQTTMGSPTIRLAVIDGGTDISHNDLNGPGKNVAPIDLMVNPPDNNPLGGNHGTQCAGMAVASANNRCAVVGSAPNCQLIPIKAGDTVAQLIMAKGFQYAADNGADVITCSLGPNSSPWTMTDALREAIDYATTYGRNGRGCAYFQAVDNDRLRADGVTPNPISGDQVSAYERSIAVSRTNNRDQYDSEPSSSPFSFYVGPAMGQELDLCAPGGNVLTITNTNINNACTIATVTGTSFAAPLASGVACLVLSVNPNLSWEEVRQVLLDSADKIDAAANPYNPAPAGRPPGTRNDRYGYGRVNAQRAVQLAQVGSTRDLYIRDTIGDNGTVPQPAWGFWDSPDIWVRNNDDGGTVHQNTIRGQDNFLYARVSNRGTQASLPCWVRFYVTTFAGTEFRYPFDYKPDTTTGPAGGTPGNLRPRNQFPAPATYLIGVQRIESVPAGGNVITKIRWERDLIPPAVNWHPCLLVEISPHDGPAPAGQYVWESNNLGQKNITIIDARRGQLIEYPYRFSHIITKDPFVTLDIKKVKAPRNLQVYVDVKNPKLLEAIAGLAGVPIPVVPITPVGSVTPLSTISPISRSNPNAPWRLTFLEEAKIAFSSADSRAEHEGLVVTFPRGSSVEIGSDRTEDLKTEEGLETAEMLEGTEEVEEERKLHPIKPAFSVTTLEGTNVLALNPVLKLSNVKVPLEHLGWKESVLKIRVPENAAPGDNYVFDVAERNSKGQLVGGVRLQVNVIA